MLREILKAEGNVVIDQEIGENTGIEVTGATDEAEEIDREAEVEVEETDREEGVEMGTEKEIEMVTLNHKKRKSTSIKQQVRLPPISNNAKRKSWNKRKVNCNLLRTLHSSRS